MSSYLISDAATRTGFTQSALRYYESAGVVVPDRLENGYRSYDDGHLASLRFLARSKRLGLSLDDASELLTLMRHEECRPVQGRMRQMVEERAAESAQRIRALIEFNRELDAALRDLESDPTTGPCGDGCACTGESHIAKDPIRLSIEDPTIACSLTTSAIEDRLADWHEGLSDATERIAIDGGIKVVLPRETNLTAITSLVVAESECCSFFEFEISVTQSEVSLSITGPDSAQEAVRMISGAV